MGSWAVVRTAVVALVAAAAAVALSGCATVRLSGAQPNPSPTPTSVAAKAVLMPPGCGWMSIWEYDGSAAPRTPAEALTSRIAWNDANPRTPDDVEGMFFPRSDETLMLKAALRSLTTEAAVEGENSGFIRVDAVDANGDTLGGVMLEKSGSGWNVGETSVVHNTSGLFDCEQARYGLAGEDD